MVKVTAIYLSKQDWHERMLSMARLVKRRWEADLSVPGGRRHKQSFSYDAFVPDRIADADPVLPSTVSALCSEAEQAIQALNLSPPRLISLEALARRLLRSEAVASSWIEGIRISHRRLAKVEASSEENDPTAQAVLGNVTAMEESVQLGASQRALRLADILDIHAGLMRSTMQAEMGGRLRTKQNWIGTNPYSPAGATFVPPPEDEVKPLMEDLVAFCNRADLPPTVQAAMAHAQFETIHPFGDGNGRTGRALIHLVLRRRGLTPRFVPPVSLVLATNRDHYITGLVAFREGRLAEWVEVFARTLHTATQRAADLASEVAQLQDRWRERAGHPRADSSAEALIAALPAYPVLTVAAAAKVLDRSVQAANTALAQLEAAGVVTQVSLGRRNRAFEAKELLQLVNVFERRLGTADDGQPGRRAPARKRTRR
jgi:Fic family protein